VAAEAEHVCPAAQPLVRARYYRLVTDEGYAASVVTYLLPIVALILGALILRESVSAWSVVGVAVVLAGVALTRSRSREDIATVDAR